MHYALNTPLVFYLLPDAAWSGVQPALEPLKLWGQVLPDGLIGSAQAPTTAHPLMSQRQQMRQRYRVVIRDQKFHGVIAEMRFQDEILTPLGTPQQDNTHKSYAWFRAVFLRSAMRESGEVA